MLRVFALATVSFFMSAMALTHELPDDRVTIVQREPTHLSITFYVDEVGLLQRLIAPSSSRAEFLLACVGTPPDQFRQRLQRAQTSFERELKLLAGGQTLAIAPLHWPPMNDTLRRLQDGAMATITTGSDHDRIQPVEITTDALSSTAFESVTFITPPSLPNLLVVAYRPIQHRPTPETRAVVIDF